MPCDFRQETQTREIVEIVLLFIYIVFSAVGFHQWHKYRTNFILTQRFPILSILIYASLSLTLIISTIDSYQSKWHLCSKDGFSFIGTVRVTLMYTTVGLVCYRTNIIFLKWQYTHRRLQYLIQNGQMIEMLANSTNIHIPTKSIFKAKSAIIIAIMIIVGSVFVFGSRIDPQLRQKKYIAYTPFTPLMIVTIMVVYRPIRYRVSTHIGCTTESMFTIVGVFSMFILAMALPLEISSFCGIIFAMLMGFIGIYLPLYYISKLDMKSKRSFNKTLSVSVTVSTQIDLSSLYHENKEQDEKMSSTLQVPVKRKKIKLDKKLSKFLVRYENYKAFATFLANCFALENLLFVERAMIYRHLVLRLIENWNIDVGDGNSLGDVGKLKFQYASDIYVEYERMIGACYLSGMDVDIDEYFDDIRNGLFSIALKIYRQFIVRYAAEQVNIAYSIREKLCQMLDFNDLHSNCDETVKQFESLSDMINIFDDSIVEAWRLCDSVYAFRFKMYVARENLNV